MEQEPPDFRATVRRDGSVRLVDWGPWLAAGGPLYTLLEGRARAGVAIADLTVIRDEQQVAIEVIVDFRGRARTGPPRRAVRVGRPRRLPACLV